MAVSFTECFKNQKQTVVLNVQHPSWANVEAGASSSKLYPRSITVFNLY